MIQINGTIVLGRSLDADLRAALATMAHASRAEDGCLDYAFAQDVCDPGTLILFERWRDAEALAAHGQSAHMQAFRAVMAAHPPARTALRRYETDEGVPLGE